jgi:hypothetical protein
MPRRQLTTRPTTAAWRQEIRDLVCGELDASIRALGSAEEHVERILADAKNARLTRDTFQDALTEHLTEWQPDRDDVDDYEIERICELISAFTPRLGFSKLLRLLAHWRETKPFSEGSFETQMRALAALEMYYEQPPFEPEDDPAFQSYLAMLSGLLVQPLYITYVVRRLVELGTRAQVALIVNDERLLDVAVRGAVAEFASTSSTQFIEAVLRGCLSTGVSAVERFKDLMEAAAATLELGDQDLHIVYGGIEVRITIPDSESFRINYYAARVGIYQKNGASDLDEFVYEDNDG